MATLLAKQNGTFWYIFWFMRVCLLSAGLH